MEPIVASRSVGRAGRAPTATALRGVAPRGEVVVAVGEEATILRRTASGCPPAPFFHDDFESGDTLEWSVVQP
ncbi:MAG: hypothetical protein AAGE94_24075 [Acidobacteriota bacterium]